AGATIATGQTLTANGQSTFSPNGTNGVTINTDADSLLKITGLGSATGSILCIDGSNNVNKCANSSISLQAAYNAGNAITTTDNRDIAFTLADTTTDSKFTVQTATGSTGDIEFTRADGAGTADPSQLVLIKNLDTDRALPVGLKIAGVSGGNVTTAIDLTDANIGTAIALGTNNVTGTNFSITGSTGDVTSAGNLAVNGGTVSTTASTGN